MLENRINCCCCCCCCYYLFAEKEDHGDDAMPTEFMPLVEKKLNEKKANDQDEQISPVIWDFAGQDIFRAIHPMFMYPEDLYLLVFDITQQLSDSAKCQVDQSIVQARDSDDTNWDHVMRWFELIHSLNQCDEKEMARVESLSPPVIVVGTHAVSPDPSTDEAVMKTKLMELPEVFSKHIVNCLPIDNEKAGLTEDQDKIERLREEILHQAKKLPHTENKIPLQWHRVEKEITKVREQEKYLKKTVFRTEIASRFCDGDYDELLYFLQARGSIIFHKCLGKEDDLVVLDPEWLIGVLCTIVNVKPCCKGENPLIAKEREDLEKKGILGNNLLDHALKRQGLDAIKDSLMSLLERFNLICTWPAEKQLILVPCMMKTEAQKVDAADKASVFLTFDRMNYVPAGLFCLLVVLFAEWLSDPQRCHEYELFANKSKFALDKYHFLHLVSYKTVIKLFIEEKSSPSGDSSISSKHFVDVLR